MARAEDIDDKWSPLYSYLGQKYGLDPDLFKAISLQENVNPAYNNPLGRSGNKGVYKYSEAQAPQAIESQAKLLTDPNGPYGDFVKSGSIYDLAKVYSPVGARNDLKGTNADEPGGILSNMVELKGLHMPDEQLQEAIRKAQVTDALLNQPLPEEGVLTT